MKKRSTLLFIAILIAITEQSNSQVFTEVSNYGWGGGISESKITSADIDNNGKIDFIIGTKAGPLFHYEQKEINSNELVFISSNFSNINPGEYSAPMLYDIDGDGLMDLLCAGEMSIKHYEQDFPGSLNFTLLSSNFLNISDFQLSMAITDLNNNGLADLLIGSDFFGIRYYEQVLPNSYNFTLVTSSLGNIYFSMSASFCAHDIDGNDKIDILVGDYNHLQRYEQIAPGSLNFIEIPAFHYLFEGKYWINNPYVCDFNSDGFVDLLIGNSGGNIVYLEQSEADFNQFNLVTNNLVPPITYGGSYPMVKDFDNDGLMDLLIGSYLGSILHYEQVSLGSTNFNVVDSAFSQIYTTERHFACEDINGNGLLDLLIGRWAGSISHYVQSAPGSYNFNFVTDYFSGISQLFESKPFLFDLDNDGLWNLITGTGSGTIYHYEQAATGSLVFVPGTDQITGLPVGNEYYHLATSDLDNDAKLDIFICADPPPYFIEYYEEATPGELDFQRIEHQIGGIDGNVTTFAFVDLTGNGRLDLITGDYNGNVKHYEEDTIPSIIWQNQGSYHLPTIDVGFNSTPLIIDLNGDGYLEMLIGRREGTIFLYKQSEPGSTQFDLITDAFSDINIGPYTKLNPTIVDLNNNQKYDLIIGLENGKLMWYEQTNPNSLEFSLVSNSLSSINVGSNAAPAFADFNADGLLDLIIGNSNGTLSYYIQEWANSEYFFPIAANFGNIDVGDNANPVMVDLDNDGLLDLLVGNAAGTIYHYQQSGMGSDDFILINQYFNQINVGLDAAPAIADINNDGLMDIVVGKGSGGLNLYLQIQHIVSLPFQESLSKCAFPVGWSQKSDGSVPLNWNISESDFAGGVSCEFMVQNHNSNGILRLVSPWIDVSGSGGFKLQFQHFFDDDAAGLTLKVQSSVDGIIWNDEPWQFMSGGGNTGPEIIDLNISDYSSDLLQIAFVLSGDMNNFDFWAIDNIFMYDSLGPPANTSLIYPADQAMVYNGTGLEWEPVPNASGYYLYFGTDNPPTNIVNGSSFSYTIYQPDEYLVENSWHLWKVVPYNSFGQAQNSETWNFYVKPLSPPSNLQANSNYNTVHLSWSPPSPVQKSILVIDLDPNQNSGIVIESVLNEIGLAVTYTTSFPMEINNYDVVFVCLGIYGLNHILTFQEGQWLADYLNQGGNLYMEGGDTWSYDTPTAVHPMFKINGVLDGTSDLGTILGIAGTFAEGMEFTYGGDNAYIDHIEPINPAFLLFENQTPVYGTGVAHNGGIYRTIGVSFEFGGLQDNAFPSTIFTLMTKYLEFFDISLKNVPEDIVSEVQGYNIYRSMDNGSTYEKINSSIVQDTSYLDEGLLAGIYYYFTRAVYDAGLSIPSNVDTADVMVAIERYGLSPVRIYPNPANDNLFVETVHPLTNAVVIITAMDGNRLLSKSLGVNQTRVEVGNLKPGTYIITVEQNGRTIVTEKLVLQ